MGYPGAGFDPIAAGGLWDENGQSLVDEARDIHVFFQHFRRKPEGEKIEGVQWDEPFVVSWENGGHDEEFYIFLYGLLLKMLGL